ncbi:MAG: hypothetical protein ACFFD1_01870 [Candidatus Thorarchaeota archaeon]
MEFIEKQIKIEIPAIQKEITVTVTPDTSVQDVIDYIVNHFNQEETEEIRKEISQKLVLLRNQNKNV